MKNFLNYTQNKLFTQLTTQLTPHINVLQLHKTVFNTVFNHTLIENITHDITIIQLQLMTINSRSKTAI